MKLFKKIILPNGNRQIYLCGIKIFSYNKHIKYPNNCCDIYNYEQLIKQGTKFPHLLGIVISRAAKIGNNCIIYQNVTIGAKNFNDRSSYLRTLGTCSIKVMIENKKLTPYDTYNIQILDTIEPKLLKGQIIKETSNA